MSDEKLKACDCHFCGSTATGAAFSRISDDFQGWQVECSTCGAMGPMNQSTEAEAINAWNAGRRSTPTPTAEKADVVEAVAIAVGTVLHGENFDPFYSPEAFELCCDMACAAMKAMRPDSVDLESTFGPILKERFPDYDSLTRFHAAHALAEAAIAAMQARSADPECENCHGMGETFQHADDCDNDSCALNGDMDSCQGKVEPCHCSLPAEPAGEEPVVVPRYATDEMMVAGLYHMPDGVEWPDLFTAWHAMFDAISQDGGMTASLPATPSNPDRLVEALAELEKIADQVGEGRDPFAAWETIDAIIRQRDIYQQAVQDVIRCPSGSRAVAIAHEANARARHGLKVGEE